jgi:ribosomal protein S12 methylthiotransferase
MPRPKMSLLQGVRVKQPYVVHVISLGCAKNLVDTEVICGGLASRGIMLSAERNGADMVLVNTCGFIEDARTEADQEILAALRWKRKGRNRAVAVAGCLPRRLRAQASELYPELDLFIGLDDVGQAADLIQAFVDRTLADRNLPPEHMPSYLYDHTAPRLPLTPPSYGYVKIAEGCDHRCSYCIIPDIRGRQRSRSIDSVVEECRQLLDQGRLELDLIAQDTTRYGLDRADGANLAKLIEAVDQIEGDFLVRILYTHPYYLTDEMIRAASQAEHVAPYIDIPLQHISTPVLKAMRRGLDGPATRERMARLRELWPGVAVRTTFLLGFPGETDEQAEEVMEFCREYKFERLGAFAFSPEEGTRAVVLENQVPRSVAEARRDALLAQQQGISLAWNQNLVGETVTVLVDAAADRRNYLGRTVWDAPEIDNVVHFRGPRDALERGFVEVRIDKADAYDLHGRALE